MSGSDNSEPILIEEGVEQESNKWQLNVGNKNMKDRIRNILNSDNCLTETYVLSTKPFKLTLNEIHSSFTYHPVVIHGITIMHTFRIECIP